MTNSSVDSPTGATPLDEKEPRLAATAQFNAVDADAGNMPTPVRTLSSSQEGKFEKEKSLEEDSVVVVESSVPAGHRAWYSTVPFVSKVAKPSPKSLDDAPIIPVVHASWFSRMTFGWISPLLAVGYARPLEATDLWALDETRSAHYFAKRIDESFARRVEAADEYNSRLARGEITPGVAKRVKWTIKGDRQRREEEWRAHSGKRKPSLLWALNDAIKSWFWIGILIKFFADTAQICSPLLAIINFSAESYYFYKGHTPGPPPNVGKGIGMAFGLILLLAFASICNNQSMYRLASSGVYIRAGLIASIFNRSLRLTNRARSAISNGKLIAHVSNDVSRIDFALSFAIGATAPIQIIICLILLLLNLGWSCLPGFALFFVITPFQTIAMKRLFLFRKKAMVWTDKRSKLLQELLGGMRIIKYFSFEGSFLERIAMYRFKEIRYVRSLLIIRSAINAIAFSLPTIATIVAFITYSLSGHDLNPAILFASLSFFQLLRMPLMFLPMTLSSATDAVNAIQRLQGLFEAEMIGETKVIDKSLPVAVCVKDANFTWDAPPPDTSDVKVSRKHHKSKTKAACDSQKSPGLETPVPEREVFKLSGVNLEIPRGQLCAVVGMFGSGKSSLVQGLIGEMRMTSGSVTFGGSIAYCPQIAWIQSTSIRENILFGQRFDGERYWEVVRCAELDADLRLFPAGDLTQVGERGISLSGGQKQRISIARALYCSADVTILDDPLSALDAHVGQAVFKQAIQGFLGGKTRILVTHALHFLPVVDYIITMDGHTGNVKERGRYDDLIRQDGEFARLIREFGGQGDEEDQDVTKKEEVSEKGEKKGGERGYEAASALMQEEERVTGAVGFSVYRAYFASAYGFILVPLLIMSLVLSQAANIMNSYWLVFWQERQFPRSNGFYMGIYGALGVAQALTMFLMGLCFTLINYFSAKNLHAAAIRRVMYAPMSFFDTTPLGRIMNRFTKDIDTLDNLIADAFRMMAGTLGQIIGTIILVSVILPWFLLPVLCILTLYYWGSIFYRSSARELKRLDSILRSVLYAHYAESLSGLPTIRAYGESNRFLEENHSKIDRENRAYLLTVINQRWLGIRLDFLGSLLTFFVALLAVLNRDKVSPSQTGLVLSYMLVVQQAFGWFVRQVAEVENDSNAIERLIHYGQDIETESPHEAPLPEAAVSSWPKGGQLIFKDVQMSYRPGLPTVLKGLSFTIQPGESIGLVGRSGAGKSSVMVAIYRLTELLSGTIELDGVDISRLGLDDLRRNLAIIPQDPLLFSGTIRTNLDPFGVHDDILLWDTLRRAHLIDEVHGSAEHSGGGASDSHASRFTLDTMVEEEGSNLSVGERSLVSLARALVKPSVITLLDEATASVDYATDQLIQETITKEFQNRTLICIAHRLRTILGYDRVCVMDAGRVVEFDTPLNLYRNPQGVFRGMCDRSSIGEMDITTAMRR